ncbi:MAG: cytochrome c oxidase subunit [Gaiellales bacterium]|jgi:cytochrome c oxidase subunit 2|nr:cytochrome c oxidase subunit [Gaiellales bacterium]
MKPSRHFGRFLAIWLGSSAIATPLVAFLLTPDLPPGTNADDAQGQVLDNEILTLVATPIFLLIVVFLGYVLVVFRQTGPEVEEGPRIYGHAGAQTTWIVASTAIVLALFAYGTWRLLDAGAAGGGQGPSPLSPAGGKSVLPVQVIGQQWQFTYRYPTYGGLETARLVLPLGRTAELHVTSLDVIHSFWAYQLGVKADANPGVDNIVYVTPTRVGTFDVRCAEICGIWHGYMFDKGRVVGRQEFEAWIRDQQRVFGPVLPYLPPYGRTYLPDPQRRAG